MSNTVHPLFNDFICSFLDRDAHEPRFKTLVAWQDAGKPVVEEERHSPLFDGSPKDWHLGPCPGFGCEACNDNLRHRLAAKDARIADLEREAQFNAGVCADHKNVIRLQRDMMRELEAKLEKATPPATASGWLQERDQHDGQMREAQARIAELEKQLPDGMEHCKIRFVECSVGHGRLTATNWTETPCPWCKIKDLAAKLAEAYKRISDLMPDLSEAHRCIVCRTCTERIRNAALEEAARAAVAAGAFRIFGAFQEIREDIAARIRALKNEAPQRALKTEKP
jgi:uncharacterized coiled-coil protein SlyX